MISFASDNYASVHPKIMQALVDANHGHVPAYGNDEITQKAIKLIQQTLSEKAKVWFVGTGTAANTLAIKASLRSYQSVICTDSAHIQCNETGAPEQWCGVKLLTCPHEQGKLTPEAIRKVYNAEACWGQHATKPRLVSISQTTEFGTVYYPEELSAIRAVCDELDLLLHMDGCRLYNAAAELNVPLEELVKDIDVLSLGGTKAGLMFGEAVVFLNPELAQGFEHLQKQGLQLFSKMRYVSAQFLALFTDNLGLDLAAHSNQLATSLADSLQRFDGVELLYPAESNMFFARLPQLWVETLQAHTYFYIMPGSDIARFVLSHDVQQSHVDDFVEKAKQLG
ncbi:low specificity L-threonine aldolase [Aliikangiella sp. G2MR2-5]|uniref:threonine aldolase family protein n=1 Tax=Aliikangiella sp. G2MR2-5 TaxID=2788943 RepID=UPI0018AAE6C2|nr:low specificity L-threonine aldolase [Aliikangiella sp. G2MR2-5]